MRGAARDGLTSGQRFYLGCAVVFGASLLQLVPIGWSPLSKAPWPIALLWAVCGWSSNGLEGRAVLAIFGLGLWLDAITGAGLGTWALVGLVTYGLTVWAQTYLGAQGIGRGGAGVVTGVIMGGVVVGLGLVTDQQVRFLAVVPGLLLAVALYPLVWRWFDVSEGET